MKRLFSNLLHSKLSRQGQFPEQFSYKSNQRFKLLLKLFSWVVQYWYCILHIRSPCKTYLLARGTYTYFGNWICNQIKDTHFFLMAASRLSWLWQINNTFDSDYVVLKQRGRHENSKSKKNWRQMREQRTVFSIPGEANCAFWFMRSFAGIT